MVDGDFSATYGKLRGRQALESPRVWLGWSRCRRAEELGVERRNCSGLEMRHGDSSCRKKLLEGWSKALRIDVVVDELLTDTGAAK